MDSQNASLLASLADRMRFLSARTATIAHNLANADTPNFTPSDVSPGRPRVGVALRTSDPRHLTTPREAERFDRRPAPDGDASLTGNRVSLETQMLKLSSTRMQHGLAARVYEKTVDLLRLAANDGR
ncbi:MAG: flagellar basal body rod protein FlgB [Parvularculaceae bacterium]